MNIPTSSPAQAVNGFMVGSGGGGVNKVEGLPDSLVYPEEVKDFLEENDYIVDIRLTTSGIETIEELFQQLALKERTRAETYVELCRRYKIDFGFVVDRATTIVQYLCMSEIETYIAMKSMPEIASANSGQDPISDGLLELLEDFYRGLDNNIKFICDSLNPEHLILTADHSTVPYKYKANMNKFLEEASFLVRPSDRGQGILQRCRKMAQKHLPARIKQRFKAKMPQKVIGMVQQIDWQKTVAFGYDYIDGIYINDTRFNGPVLDEDRDEVISKIQIEFNKHPMAIEYGVTIQPYRSVLSDSRFERHLPDLILDKTDELHVVGKGEFIYQNENYGPVPDITTITDDMYSGQKGRDPVFIINDRLADLVKEEDPSNLTLAYTLAERVFNDQP
jgi:hypothetical protein